MVLHCTELVHCLYILYLFYVVVSLSLSKTLRIWEVDRENRKIRPQECDLGQLKRDVRCILIDGDDEYLYAGTTSGDILQVCSLMCARSVFGILIS